MEFMRSVVALLILSFLLLTPDNILAQRLEQIDEFGSTSCCDEMARLDNLINNLKDEPNVIAYVIIYGGRRGTARGELNVRRSRIKRYLINYRGMDGNRVVVVDGGFRENLTVELWIVDARRERPEFKPTVTPKEVRYRKGKYIVDCSLFY